MCVCSSKIETTWVLGFDIVEHVIELRSSKITGKRQLKVNGLEIFKGYRYNKSPILSYVINMCRTAPKFSHEFKIGKHRVLLVEFKDG